MPAAVTSTAIPRIHKSGYLGMIAFPGWKRLRSHTATSISRHSYLGGFTNFGQVPYGQSTSKLGSRSGNIGSILLLICLNLCLNLAQGESGGTQTQLGQQHGTETEKAHSEAGSGQAGDEKTQVLCSLTRRHPVRPAGWREMGGSPTARRVRKF